MPWNIERIGARRVHSELKVTGKGSVVAMFESGVNLMHSSLRNAAWVNSEAFAKGHRQGSLMGVLQGPPEIKTYQAIIEETPEGRKVEVS